MRIVVIQMGGTIDKQYPQIPNAYGFVISEAKSHEILNQWKNTFSFDTHTIARKDSQDLNEEDLNNLLNFVKSTDYDGYLITHGTDTIHETGKFIKDRVSAITKNIVLSGSRLPACVVSSDATLNLGMSIGVLHCKESGVHVVIDGIVKQVI